jgi:hypothetical protein
MADSAQVAVVRRLYEARGNPDIIRQVLAPDIRWEVVAGFPYGGVYAGLDQVLGNFFGRLFQALARETRPEEKAARRDGGSAQDEDFGRMSLEQLVAEVKRLREGIREHRDSTGHELCWHHPALWGLLPDATDPQPVVPDWPEFLRGCIRYRQSLDTQAPRAPRTSQPYES